MPEYDAENFDPPAPVAFVTLRNPVTGVWLPDVPMLIDTGADATLLPADAVRKIGVGIETDSDFEVETFDGETKRLQFAKLELFFLNKKFAGAYLLIDRPMGILGRNVLNNLRLVLDGIRQKWDEQK
jgi:predicted aspartyl protease